jgi:hypothetical protein
MVAREAEEGHPAHNDFGADPGHAGGAAGSKNPEGASGQTSRHGTKDVFGTAEGQNHRR